MTIEIRELIIKATITEGHDITSEVTSSSTGGDDLNEKRIVATCVDQVLKVLTRSRER